MTNWRHHHFIQGAIQLVLADQQAQQQVSVWAWRQARDYLGPQDEAAAPQEVRQHLWDELFYGGS